MQQKQLSEFYGVTDRAVRKWSDDKTNRKTIQAEADVTPLEWQLVGEIAQLCYLYNAQNWVGSEPIKRVWVDFSSFSINLSFFVHNKPETDKVLRANVSNTAEMQLIKMQLEKLVY